MNDEQVCQLQQELQGLISEAERKLTWAYHCEEVQRLRARLEKLNALYQATWSLLNSKPIAADSGEWEEVEPADTREAWATCY